MKQIMMMLFSIIFLSAQAQVNIGAEAAFNREFFLGAKLGYSFKLDSSENAVRITPMITITKGYIGELMLENRFLAGFVFAGKVNNSPIVGIGIGFKPTFSYSFKPIIYCSITNLGVMPGVKLIHCFEKRKQ